MIETIGYLAIIAFVLFILARTLLPWAIDTIWGWLMNPSQAPRWWRWLHRRR